ncbi:MAG TPA: InlB B-repeat-containing protein [Candidatus Borkfalkia excrementipullorum]|nr:InlB B-repeat-containing protein [Candidatus Borkfalkia excrementipullorum]
MKRNRLTLSIWIALLFIIAVICLGVGCVNEAEEQEIYEIRYLVEDEKQGGIEGSPRQYVRAGEDARAVEAEAKEGYKFVGWSDGVKSAWRQDKAIQGDMTVYAEFEKEKYEVRYTAGEGGRIEGKSEQEVAYREDGEPVTAVAEFGYMFVKWSDGNESAERQDTRIKEPLEVAAEFARLEKTYQYNYNYATGGDEEKEVKIHIDHMDAAEFPVPVKEHSIFGGWYADKERTIAVTDAKGNRVIGQELFRVQTDTLYAKWTAEEEVNYKILLVFVTEIDIHKSCKPYDTGYIDIEYTLTEEEQKLCKMIPRKLEEKLNEIFYGLIHFEIDTYFTKEPVTGDMAFGGISGDPFNDPLSISAPDIPEVRPLINKYRAVLTTFNLNDYDEKYHTTMLGGLGSRKFAKIYLDSFLDGIDIESMWDTRHERYEDQWNNLLETYLHEFCHTIEKDFGYADYHDAVFTDRDVYKSTLEVTEEYLLGLAEYEGELVGVPYDYWIGNVEDILVRYYTVMRLNGENIFWGELQRENSKDTSGTVTQEVPYGGTADAVTAIAYPGYRFVKWSDGVTTATRQDKNITSYFQAWAIFEPIE